MNLERDLVFHYNAGVVNQVWLLQVVYHERSTLFTAVDRHCRRRRRHLHKIIVVSRIIAQS